MNSYAPISIVILVAILVLALGIENLVHVSAARIPVRE